MEYNFIDGDRVEFSVGVGAHFGDSDFGNQRGLDLTPLVSYKPVSLPGFKWNGALDLAWDRLSRSSDNPDVDDRYTSVYLVPGAEYRIARGVDVIGELGLGLNSASNEYLSAGFAFYFR